MQHDRIAALGLSLALAATMTVPALAAEGPMLISGNPNSYRYSITVNGEAVDTSALPNVDGLPVRLVAEADHGSASWYEGESTAYVSMTGGFFVLNFADGSVTLDDEKVADLTVANDTTFLPISFFEGLEGVTVTVSGNSVDIATPNNDPLVKLSYALSETANLRGIALNSENVADFCTVSGENFQDGRVAGFAPMMISPDTLIVGKLAEGKEADAKAQWDEYVQVKYDLHSWYLGQHLPKVEDARFEVENGYVLCLIAENADETVAAFREAVKGL